MIATRVAFPSCEIVDSAMESLEKCGISRDLLTIVDHSHCDFCHICEYEEYPEEYLEHVENPEYFEYHPE